MSFHSKPSNYQSRKDVIQTPIHSHAGVHNGSMNDDQDIRVRKYGEVVYNTLSSVASVLEYPKGNFSYSTVLFIKKLIEQFIFYRSDKGFSAAVILGAR